MIESIEKLSRAIMIPNRAKYSQSSPICAMLVRRPLIGDRFELFGWIWMPLVLLAAAAAAATAVLEVWRRLLLWSL